MTVADFSIASVFFENWFFVFGLETRNNRKMEEGFVDTIWIPHQASHFETLALIENIHRSS